MQSSCCCVLLWFGLCLLRWSADGQSSLLARGSQSPGGPFTAGMAGRSRWWLEGKQGMAVEVPGDGFTAGTAGNGCRGTWRRNHCRNGWEVKIVTGREAGKSCISTWRRFHCRNGWEVEMVAIWEAGNGCTSTWRRVYCRNG